MTAHLSFTRYPYEEPYHIQLLLEASNGRQQASIEYYTNVRDLPDLGKALIQFPFAPTHEYIYEIGSEDPTKQWAYHVRLRFFLIRPTGDAGIEIHFNNNRPAAPYREIADFTILAEVAGINRLGELLTEFGRLNYRKLEWDGVQGRLLEPEEADAGNPELDS